jgi:ankyrin repeat protein
LVQYLIEHGADINKENNEGETPLFKACRWGYDNEIIVQYLIENGADINKKNNEGETPLFIACHCRNYNVAQCLIVNIEKMK